MPRLITRHANRKLYDPSARRYVSLSDIADLVIAGDSVRVVQHPGGEDATPRILALGLVDLIKRRAQSLPVGLMETLVRLAGGSKGLASEGTAPVKDFAERTRKEAETIATRLVARGRLGIEEALHLRKEVEDAIHRRVQAAEAATRKPMDALRPGRAVRTIAGLARELKALETMVARPKGRPPTPSLPEPEKARAPRRKSSHKPRK
jgi:hypothetical protein